MSKEKLITKIQDNLNTAYELNDINKKDELIRKTFYDMTELKSFVNAKGVIRTYRKKPMIVKAIRYDKEHIGRLLSFCGVAKYNPHDNEYYIDTLEGCMKITDGDYIIKGVNGEFYPCKADIFKKTYEEV